MIELWKRLRRYVQVKSAIKHANKMHQLTAKRYYVIQVFKKIRVYDRLHINHLISRGVLHPRLKKAYELNKVCLYITPSNNTIQHVPNNRRLKKRNLRRNPANHNA